MLCVCVREQPFASVPLFRPPHPPVNQVNQFNYRDPPHLSDPFSDSIGIVFVTALAWGWAVRLQISPLLPIPFPKTIHVGCVMSWCVILVCGSVVIPKVVCAVCGTTELRSCVGDIVAPALNCVSHRAWAGP